MNWDDIKIFLEVARSERLSEAAKRLNIDASTISRRLHKLEENVVCKLFERTIDGHILTDEGERLLRSACKMEQDAYNALNDIKNSNKPNEVIYKPDDIRLISSKYLKEIILMFKGDNDDGIFEKIVLDTNYQILFIKLLIDKNDDFKLPKEPESKWDFFPSPSLIGKNIDKAVREIHENQAKISKKKEDRDEEILELTRKKERHIRDIRGMTGESILSTEKNNNEQIKESKFTKKNAWITIIISIIMIVLAVATFFK